MDLDSYASGAIPTPPLSHQREMVGQGFPPGAMRTPDPGHGPFCSPIDPAQVSKNSPEGPASISMHGPALAFLYNIRYGTKSCKHPPIHGMEIR